ncbi:MAG: hypothetical protein ABJC39_02985 [Chloroflexota bacterium]
MVAWVVGAIAIVLAFVVGQQWFYEHHRRRYGLWRSMRERWFGAPDRTERGAMIYATTHRDPDPVVERSRRVYLATIVACVVAGLIWLELMPRGR